MPTDESTPPSAGEAPSGGTVRAADEFPLLFEHSGWGIYTRYDPAGVLPLPSNSLKEGNCLTHVGCDCEFPNWHLGAYIWKNYGGDEVSRFYCDECKETLSTEAFNVFCQVYKLLNR